MIKMCKSRTQIALKRLGIRRFTMFLFVTSRAVEAKKIL